MAPHPALEGTTLNGEASKLDVCRYLTGGHWVDQYNLVHGPSVTLALLPEATDQDFIRARNIIDHSNAGTTPSRWRSLWGWLLRKDVTIEPHFQVDMDGSAAQFIPLDRVAHCNAKANRWRYGTDYWGAISFETADLGSAALPTTPWSPEQFETLVALHTLVCIVYRVRCTACTSWDDGGIDYHSKFPEWSVYRGKTCPGAARIRQMDELRRRVAVNVAAWYEHCGGTCP